MSEILFRNLKKEDVTECTKLFLKIFGPEGCGDPWTEQTSQQAVEESIEHPSYCFVATIDTTIIGFVLAAPVPRDADINVYIEWIGVLSAYQGQHVGSTLLEKVESIAKQNGNKYMSLYGHPKYLSFDWYKNKGMKETGWVELIKDLQ